MSKPSQSKLPPDQTQRERALDAARSILVRAPAGSGKTDLLTRRYLRLLGEVSDPGQIVAITFTNAAAAEMRHRILWELEKAAALGEPAPDAHAFSMEALAWRALERSRVPGWRLIDLPAQLRISTIDSFCRDLALQQPMLTSLGGELDIHEQPTELYRRAARRTLETIGATDARLSAAIEALLLWRDNGWQELEDLLVTMLSQRDRWMQDFLLKREPDWDALRARLEKPFERAVQELVGKLGVLFNRAPGALDEALALARFACEQSDGEFHQELAEIAEFPSGPFFSIEALEEARHAWLGMAALLLANGGTFRRQVDIRMGFPADRKAEKGRFAALAGVLRQVSGLESILASVRKLPPARYMEDDWKIVQACFMLLRHAAAELQIVFAESGSVDFTEVAQIAQHVLKDEDSLPSEAAMTVADGIHHLLVDEFQDTSRRQHRLVASLAAAWPDPAGRTIFVVGDPMQSIYFFRDADAELFPRVEATGLDIPENRPWLLDPVSLTANFRTDPDLVMRLNESFGKVFAENDGSGVSFTPSEPAREAGTTSSARLSLHFEFMPQTTRSKTAGEEAKRRNDAIQHAREAALTAQVADIVTLIRSHQDRMEEARGSGRKYRIAVLGRTRKALAPVAEALRNAAIPFRAVELEQLKDRPEVLDALALGRALLNPEDRIAWLGVLRAPWCGLALSDLYLLAAAENADSHAAPIPRLLEERIDMLSEQGRRAVRRMVQALESLPGIRAGLPTAAFGTWLQQMWINLGGDRCVDSVARANLDLLWSCLDGLPGGAQDLLGPALDSALERLTALPDPAASTECGVQLMTIHKSKGLEFEVVIVPEMQASGGRTRGRLLSWLERGLATPEDSGAITEFLVAPLQAKGADRGKAKEWVDSVYRERERQEMRRIFYVAATRAREELHYFARLAYKDVQGTPALVQPKDSLLATAWPALRDEAQARFDAWKTAKETAKQDEDFLIEAIAASGESNLLVMPSSIVPTRLRRLPDDLELSASGQGGIAASAPAASGIGDSRLYQRHEGGLGSRVLGTAVHRLLETASRISTAHDWSDVHAALAKMQPRIAAQVRAAGLHAQQADLLAKEAIEVVRRAIETPYGQWIIAPHADASSETAWTGIVAGALRTVRVDRVFRAGIEPHSEGDNVWWIIDYKTAHEDGLDPAHALSGLHAIFAPQLETYAAVLRSLHPGARIHAGLYYPRMSQFDWWQVEP